MTSPAAGEENSKKEVVRGLEGIQIEKCIEAGRLDKRRAENDLVEGEEHLVRGERKIHPCRVDRRNCQVSSIVVVVDGLCR